MKNTTAIADKTIRFSVNVDPFKTGRGHQPHRGGSGSHKHRNDKRQGNRSQQTKRAIGEF